MDSAHATPSVAGSVRNPLELAAVGQERWERSKNAIVSAIIAHDSLPSTMQLMADAFVALYPPKSIAIFVLAGNQFHIEAEAGLPPRPVPPLESARPAQGISGDLGLATFSAVRDVTAFQEILETGVKLCLAWPLISGSGE